ncbi:transporter [Iodidimonas muriae]|uniref:Transporter n=1 Tax=Iodidimonas muriae TaxID=261467 RepID=A0ABQ2LD55_9PROT|nr:sodium-dependent transporter [Iodidimonas muriae]GER07253.1 transporter [Kordiimonadales bacterium JCM 17843]GGO11288.1 transporter [Iodidimonas muriae]
MAHAASSNSPQFSSRFAFIFAAVGAAVGLGNVWKFPYAAGENGGAAFVAVYLIGLVLVAAPIFVAEVVIGRRGAASPPEALRRQAVEHGKSKGWRIPGLFGLLAGLFVMSFYSVIAGWTLDYISFGARGMFSSFTAETASQHFDDLKASVPRLLFWQGLFILATLGIVAMGVKKGIERAVTVMTPALGVLLILLVIYALATGDAGRAIEYLFRPDFSKLTPDMALAAVGQAFFTLSVGIGGVMMYGAYLPKDASIFRASGMVVAADTAVALLAGLAVFPIVFANGLDPSGGPGLVFVTLPLAFSTMPGGDILGTLFFFFLFIAALTSAIALYEPVAAWLAERGVSRIKGTMIAAFGSWLLGLLNIFSFNLWKDFSPLGFLPGLEGMTFFGLITNGLDKLILPIGALIISWFAGRLLARKAVMTELGVEGGLLFRFWIFSLRWITPVAVAILFLVNLI